jgi:hypothetical protein
MTQRPALPTLRLRSPMALMLIGFCATGCASAPPAPDAVSDTALCAGLAGALADHAGALARDGGPASLRSGVRLIRAIDAGCGREGPQAKRPLDGRAGGG